MKKPYKNAGDFLPLNLLVRLQEYHYGLLWVPRPAVEREQRDLRIVELHRCGVPTKEIAELAEVTERRVRQILQRERVRKRKPG